MTVIEAFKSLNQLIIDGYGNLELIFEDVRSGDTGSVSVYNSIKKVTGEETMGRLTDMPVDTKYIPVYCDH